MVLIPWGVGIGAQGALVDRAGWGDVRLRDTPLVLPDSSLKTFISSVRSLRPDNPYPDELKL